MGQGHSTDSAPKPHTLSTNNFVLLDPVRSETDGSHSNLRTQIPVAPYFLPEGDLYIKHKNGKKKKDKKRKSSSASNSQSTNGLYDPNNPNPYAVAIDPATGRYVYYPPYPLIGYPPALGGTYMGPDGTVYSSEGAIYEEIHGQRSRTSVVISTHPDPKQVTIKRESNRGSTVAVVENDYLPSQDDNNNNNSNNNRISTVITTDTNNNQNNNINGDGNKRDLPGIVVGGETISVESETVLSDSSGLFINGMLVDNKRSKKFAATNTRDSKYVTYIRDAPRPPSPPPPPLPVEELVTAEVQEEVDVALSVSSHITDAEAERFIEVGVVEESVTKILLDETITENHVISGERLSVERSQDKQTGLEEQTATVSFAETNSMDVVLCYDTHGARLAGRVKEALECLELSVMMGALWEDVTLDDVLNIARYVLTAPILVTVLTPDIVAGRYIRDLVSLAKATNRSVWPLSIDAKETVEAKMTSELRLQVSRLHWTQVAREGVVSTAKIRFLARSARDVIQSWRVRDIIDEDWGEVSSWAVRHQQVLRQIKERRSDEENLTENPEEEHSDIDVTPSVTSSSKMTATQFWDQTFPQDVNVPWDHFRSQLRSHYLTELTTQLPRTSMPPLMEIARQELTITSEQGEQVVSRAKFIAFCTDCGEDQDVWQTLCEVASTCQAVIDVLAADSTVRTVAIEAIGHHGNPFVVSSLRDLLRDPDEEIRSSAVTSLSRCMLPSDQQSFQALMIALDDREWTVRRAACLAMANIGAVDSSDRLRRLWRHDPFQPVRHAASLALVQLGMDVKDQIPSSQTEN